MDKDVLEVHLEYIREKLDAIENKFDQVDENKNSIGKIKFYFKFLGTIVTGLWAILIAWVSNKNH